MQWKQNRCNNKIKRKKIETKNYAEELRSIVAEMETEVTRLMWKNAQTGSKNKSGKKHILMHSNQIVHSHVNDG